MIELNEDLLDSDVEVIYKGKEYKTGNRYGTLTELWKDHEFFMSVPMGNITIKHPNVIVKSLTTKRNKLVNELSDLNDQISYFQNMKSHD